MTTIALFPGAFRPPHKAHYTAVAHLAGRTDIDEVVVVIANRHRHLPGTNLMMGPEVAVAVWEIYLRCLDKVRVVTAPGSAVGHALEWFGRAAPGDHLLFCVGESDLGQGDRRFASIGNQPDPRGITAGVIAAPTAELPGRATAVRRALADGERATFRRALPDHLDDDEFAAVWAVCRGGLREQSAVLVDRLRELQRSWDLGEYPQIEPVRSGKTDPVLRMSAPGKPVLFAKSAADTVKDARFDDPDGLKPRRRLSAERRAIGFLSALAADTVELPEVMLADAGRKFLVTSEVCPGGDFMDRRLAGGTIDHEALARCVQVLADGHLSVAPAPLWGAIETDREQADALLGLRTRYALTRAPRPLHAAIEDAASNTVEAGRRLFSNTDLRPGNIRLAGSRVGLIDLERCASWGDPARDLGFFAGEVIACCRRQGDALAALAAIEAACRDAVGDAWRDIRQRFNRLAGLAVFAAAGKSGHTPGPPGADMDALGVRLLAG